ncbi:hypothetical protein BJX68DRAFT_226884 [Aspergillus pseudodeflectus]|uniref:Uncharacterized protein n=1 Tax=Aspergillus pseudodeflectus TaxID=176178 RepID=A0ABR4L274_9EURO
MAVAEQALTNLRAVGLSDVLYLLGDEAYNARIASCWSLTAQLWPWAVVQPRNTEEVAKALKAMIQRCRLPPYYLDELGRRRSMAGWL